MLIIFPPNPYDGTQEIGLTMRLRRLALSALWSACFVDAAMTDGWLRHRRAEKEVLENQQQVEQEDESVVRGIFERSKKSNVASQPRLDARTDGDLSLIHI